LEGPVARVEASMRLGKTSALFGGFVETRIMKMPGKAGLSKSLWKMTMEKHLKKILSAWMLTIGATILYWTALEIKCKVPR
jgi:hypothetical protein